MRQKKWTQVQIKWKWIDREVKWEKGTLITHRKKIKTISQRVFVHSLTIIVQY